MTEEDEKLLKENGFIVECQFPFEISLEEDPTSRATGECAWLVLRFLQECEIDEICGGILRLEK